MEGILRVLKGFCLEEGEKTKRNESKLNVFQGRTDHIFGWGKMVSWALDKEDGADGLKQGFREREIESVGESWV